MNIWVSILQIVLYIIVAVMVIYAIRHYIFTLSRLFGENYNCYEKITQGDWPYVSIFVMAHNEERVIKRLLIALVEIDYPKDRYEIIPVNDRSIDNTRQIIDEVAALNISLIKPFHRTSGMPGKAAALKEAMLLAQHEIAVIFDADYLPNPQFLKQITAPFFDPEVGATMGRVVPINANINLLTTMLDMERVGGYQVDQQARMNLGGVPQYGGTAGAVRICALNEVGGWNEQSLAEDTDLTFRLILAGWKMAYQNQAICYEEVVDNWPARINQISRWAKGHNQALFSYLFPVLFSNKINWRERVDGILLLGVYFSSKTKLDKNLSFRWSFWKRYGKIIIG